MGDARNHPWRPCRLRAVLQSSVFHRASDRDPAIVEGRHVIPRRIFRLRGRRDPVRPQPRHPDAIARRYHLRGRADRAPSRAHRQFHQRRIVGPAERRALGHGVSERRPVAAPPEPALRGGPRGPGALCRPGAPDPRRRAAAAGVDHRRVRNRLRHRAMRRGILSRAGPAARISVGRPDHGHAAVYSHDPGRARLRVVRAAPATRERRIGMTPLESEIRRTIAADGPIPVAQFMALALGHPAHGYYVTHDPFGVRGDFITAPEISQMFGELVGLWAAAAWTAMGRPGRVRLVELGPGRGTLMADALRAVKVVEDFCASLAFDLVEMSPLLRQRQEQALRDCSAPLHWHARFADVPEGDPLIVIANEFFDALPVHQAVRTPDGWHERMVGIGEDEKLMLALHPDPILNFSAMPLASVGTAPVGAIYEWRSDALVTELAERLVRDGGAALIIDYGHCESACGETLQAVGRHGFAPLLERPGEVDLSAHVDFAALGRS